MTMAILATLWCLQEERITLTITFVRASQEERGGLEPALKEIEADLKEMTAFNRFEVVGSTILKYSPTAETIRTTFALREGGRYRMGFTPQQPLGGRIPLLKLWIQERKTEEEVVMTAGVMTKHSRTSWEDIFGSTAEVPEGKPSLLGSVVVEGKSGPMTILLVVKATAP